MEKSDSFEDYSKWKKKEGSRLSKVSRQIRPVFVFILAVLILGGNYLVVSGQMSRGVFFVVIVSFGILFLFMILRENPEPTLIPEHIIKQIVLFRMEQKRKDGVEIPFDAKIRVTLLSNAKYEEDMMSGTSGIVNRQVGVEVTRSNLKKSYLVSVHPYNGTILDILPMSSGLNNNLFKDVIKKDVKVVPAQFLEPKG